MQNATTNTIAVVPFQFNNSQVRAATIGDAHWFVAKDVCAILGLENVTEALRGLDKDERSTLRITEGTSPAGGNPNLNCINESGLYALIFKSRKPEAKAFRKWVTAEVLPALRKTGQYHMPAPEQPGRPGEGWFTAKEIAAAWNMNLRTVQRWLIIMVKDGRAEMVERLSNNLPNYYRFPQGALPLAPEKKTTEALGRALSWDDLRAKAHIRFIGHADEKGQIVMYELKNEYVFSMEELPERLVDPGVTLEGTPDEQRNLLYNIARAATMRASFGGNTAHALLYGNDFEKRQAMKYMTRRFNGQN